MELNGPEIAELKGSLLRVRGLGKDYGRGEASVHAVDEVSLEVAAGESVAVVGPSGCGKSTLLYLLGGLERPTRGSVWVGDEQLDRMPEARLARLRRHAVGFVFQAFHLVDELTALARGSSNEQTPGLRRIARIPRHSTQAESNTGVMETCPRSAKCRHSQRAAFSRHRPFSSRLRPSGPGRHLGHSLGVPNGGRMP